MAIASQQIDEIKEMLGSLSEDALKEVRDFIAFLAEKERRRKAFVERICKIEAESDTVTFDSVKEAMEAIRNWSE
ncbi:MAG: hypothetical protein ACK4Z9_02415 [Thermodesulfovibrionales bacterium]